MYGMVHRALQCFAQDTYGKELWLDVATDANLGLHRFEAMLKYPDDMIDDVLKSLCSKLDLDRAQMLEDFGGYLVSHSRMDPVRRLMRFGGADFEDFLLSLDDLKDRTRLAFPDLQLPAVHVESHSDTAFGVWVQSHVSGYGSVLLGFLRAMADDYGALVMLEGQTVTRNDQRFEYVSVEVFEAEFATGRAFQLSVGQRVE